jgi:dolichyl-diphosphooligosaccharide--protein glycosyltransferase
MERVTSKALSCKAAGPWAVFLLLLAVGVYFRTYEFHPQKVPSVQVYRSAAEKFVTEQIRQQIIHNLEAVAPGLSPSEKEKAATEKVREVLRADKENFDNAVEKLLLGMPKQEKPKYSRHYLLEADPYHYFDQTQEILKTGAPGKIKDNKYFDPMRVVPKGYWTPINLHPFLGAFFYRIVTLFHPEPLMETLGFVPVLLLAGVLAAFCLLCRSLGFSLYSFAAAGITLILAPVFLQRSSFGWYDTDPYNILFPSLVLGLFFLALDAPPKRSLLWTLLAGISTGLYTFFWVGWPFIFVITAGSSALLTVLGLVRREFRNPNALRFFLGYVLLSVVSAVLCSTPAGFWEFIVRGATFIGRFSSDHQEAWPNIFLTVGETNSLTLKRLIFLSGNYVTFAVMAAGVLAGGHVAFWKKGDKSGFMKWLVLVLTAAPLAILSLRTERFSLLFVLPVAAFVGVAAETFKQGLEALLEKRNLAGPVSRGLRITGAVLFMGVLLPVQLLFAHALALKSEPIMDDAWYESMMRIKNETPADAVIYNWWPPGYFLTSLAQRRIVADGGTQHLPECYWSARFFTATDETEALAILRMHLAVGNGAVDYLQENGLKLWEAMELLAQLFPLDREKAHEFLSSRLDAARADALMPMLYPEHLPPTYIYVYNEMLEKNVAMGLLARWNFKKAALKQEEAHAGFFEKRKKKDMLRDIISLSEGILKYRPEAGLQKRDGSLLYFSNGLIVNLDTMAAKIDLPKEHLDGNPVSFFFARDKKLEEIPGTGDRLDVSALMYKDGESYGSVLADRDLIRSMLFRLYYLKAEELRHFKPFFEVSDSGTGTRIQVYRVDFPAPVVPGPREPSRLEAGNAVAGRENIQDERSGNENKISVS